MTTMFMPMPAEPAVSAEIPTNAGSRWAVATGSTGRTVMISSPLMAPSCSPPAAATDRSPSARRQRRQRPPGAPQRERSDDEADLGDAGGLVLGDARAHRGLVADEGDHVEQLVGQS